MSTIVAAVDGSPSAVNAAVWAAREAGQRAATLRLVHAYVVPTRGYPQFVTTFPQLREGMRYQGEQWLREARAAAEQAAPGVPVETELVEGEPVNVLIDQSHRARILVLGSRGLGGFTGMLVGSVAFALAAHGHSPVVVVRGERPEEPLRAEGPVVVGSDGSDHGLGALAFAFEEASLRKVPLVVVRTWNDALLDSTAHHYPLSVSSERIDADEHAALEEQLAGWRDTYPDVSVEAVVVRGKPVRTLLDYGENAALLVVGSRGRGGFTGMLLGSTSQALVTHAPCPVAVVRRAEPGEGR